MLNLNANLKNKDFTIYKYESLLKSIISKKIPVYTVLEWYKNKPPKGILIRHDIDRWAKNALYIAKLENKLGIKTTYYFRKTKGSFKPKIIDEISKLGHEIGYHYEDLSLAKGDYDKAGKTFHKHLSKLRKIAEVRTCAMHGSPFSKWNNLNFWKTNKLEEFGLEAEAFLSIDYSDIYYFTDTGRSWAENSSNIRDKVNTKKKANIETTDELIDFIKKNINEKIAIVMHPERWRNNFYTYYYSYFTDIIKNLIKKLSKMILAKN